LNTVTLDNIQAARTRLGKAIYDSPCPHSVPLSEVTGAEVYCKLDYLQRTGSFKERGARNALAQLEPRQKQRGVIAASAGNHAQALAYHGYMLGIAVTVVMPRFAPLIKVANCRRLHAEVILYGETFEQARQHAKARAESQGRRYIHGFDDPAIIAGQGTMGLDVLEQVPDVDAVLVPVGGGGLLAGVSVVVKHTKPSVRVVAVEAEAAPNLSAALATGAPTPVDPAPTLADGLAVGRIGELTFATARDLIDDVVQVPEDALALSILRLLEMEKSAVEGAGAAPLAAMLGDQLKSLEGQRVALLLCGGNIDPAALSRVIEHGMVADGRLTRFAAVISDRPGGLERLAHVIAEEGASIQDIVHDRAFAGPDITKVRILCTIETRDESHINAVYDALQNNGFNVQPTPGFDTFQRVIGS